MTDIRYTFSSRFGDVGSTSAVGAWNANFVTWDNTGFGGAISRRPGYNNNYHGPNADKWVIGGVYAYQTPTYTYALDIIFFRTSTGVTEAPLAYGDQVELMGKTLSVGSTSQNHTETNAYGVWTATGGVFGGYIHTWSQPLFLGGFFPNFIVSDLYSIYNGLAQATNRGLLTAAESLYLPASITDTTEESFTNLFAGTGSSPTEVEKNLYYYATFANTRPTTAQGNGLTLSNINEPVTVQPGANGEISLSGGSVYTGGTLTAQPNDTVHFRVLSPNEFVTSLTTSLTIGTITHSGTIKTREARDITPGNFQLGPNTVTEAQPGITYNAPMDDQGNWTPVGDNVYIVSGVEGEVAATPTNGEIAINPAGTANFVSTSQAVTNGDRIRFRFTASSDFSTSTTHSLQIGDTIRTVTCTTTSNPTTNPVLTVEYEDINGGFDLKSNPVGGEGTHTFEWSTTGGGTNNMHAFNSGFRAQGNLGVVGAFAVGGEWAGTTWSVRVKSEKEGQTVISDYTSVTLPTFDIAIVDFPTGVPVIPTEGNNITAQIFHTNINSNSQVYWDFSAIGSPTDFNPMSGSLTLSDASSTLFTFYANTDNIVEGGLEFQTLRLWNHSAKTYISSLNTGNLMDQVSFNLTDTFEEPHLGIALSTDSEPDKLLTVSGGTSPSITLSNMSGTTGNHTYMITDNNPDSAYALLSQLNIMATVTNFSPTGSVDFTVSNPAENSGQIYYVWARLTSTTNSSARVWNTGKYFVLANPDRTIGWQKAIALDDHTNPDVTVSQGLANVTITGDDDNPVRVALTGHGNFCQYKVVATQTGRWCTTPKPDNNFVATFDYTTTVNGVESNTRELPPTPQPGSNEDSFYTYQVEARVRSTAIPGFPSTEYVGEHWVEATQEQQLTITRTDDADVEPDMPTFATQFNATPGAYYFREFTTTGVTSPITWNMSGGTISSSQPDASTNTTSLQRDKNETAFIQVQAPYQTNQSFTGTLSYTGGTETSTFTVTTAPAGDGSTNPVSGATGFGLEVFNEGGTQVIFGTSHSSAGHIAEGSFSVPAATGTYPNHSPSSRIYPEIGTIAELISAPNEVEIVLVLDTEDTEDTHNQINSFASSYTKNSNGTFTITNNSNLSAISGTYIVVRT